MVVGLSIVIYKIKLSKINSIDSKNQKAITQASSNVTMQNKNNMRAGLKDQGSSRTDKKVSLNDIAESSQSKIK